MASTRNDKVFFIQFATVHFSGLFMVNEMERAAYATLKIDKPMWELEESATTQPGTNIEVPDELVSF